jgi:hypothetical protein
MGPPPSPGEATRAGRRPLEYRVRLTLAAEINPEYDMRSPSSHRPVLSQLLEPCNDS